MFWLRGCPRCNGDLYEDRDKYGRYVSCVQCGYHRSEPPDINPPFLPLVRAGGRHHKLIYGRTWRWKFPCN
jgi:hypothetical protein